MCRAFVVVGLHFLLPTFTSVYKKICDASILSAVGQFLQSGIIAETNHYQFESNGFQRAFLPGLAHRQPWANVAAPPGRGSGILYRASGGS